MKLIESDEYRHILQTDNVKIDQNEYFENVGDSIKIERLIIHSNLIRS